MFVVAGFGGRLEVSFGDIEGVAEVVTDDTRHVIEPERLPPRGRFELRNDEKSRLASDRDVSQAIGLTRIAVDGGPDRVAVEQRVRKFRP